MRTNPNNHFKRTKIALASITSTIILLAGCGQQDNSAEVHCNMGYVEASFDGHDFITFTTHGRGEPSPKFTIWKNKVQGATQYDIVESINSRENEQWETSPLNKYGDSNPDYKMTYKEETWAIDIDGDGSSARILGSCPN